VKEISPNNDSGTRSDGRGDVGMTDHDTLWCTSSSRSVHDDCHVIRGGRVGGWGEGGGSGGELSEGVDLSHVIIWREK
jgi:hypothetical protein